MALDAIVLSIAMAAAAGLVGCFAVMRRMALSADALSHVALPGIGLALALQVDSMLGAVVMLSFGALLVWVLESRSGLATETVIGVVFSAALAVGAMIASGERLMDALFGGLGTVAPIEVALGLLGTAVVVVVILKQKHALVLALVSPDIARTAGVNVRRLNLVFLELFALTIALGLRYLGVLLMGSLVIIPAATAKRLSRNLNQLLATSALLAIGTTVVGLGIATRLHREPGPMIVAVGAIVFLAPLAQRSESPTRS